MEALNEKAHKLAEVLDSQAGGAAPDGAGPGAPGAGDDAGAPPPGNDDDVIDADFEEAT